MEKQVTANGAKATQRVDNEDRFRAFRDWHRNLDAELLASDIDLVEWRFKDGKLVPVAVLEVTRTDSDDVGDNYLAAILERFQERDLQARMATRVADLLGVRIFIVLYNMALTRFWVYNLTHRRGWWKLDADRAAHWLRGL